MEIHHSNEYQSIVKLMKSQIRTSDSRPRLPLTSDRSIFLTKLIANLIIHDFLSISIVESSHLQAIFHEIEPSYVIPGRKYFMKNVFDEMYNQVKQNIYTELQLASGLGFSIP